MELRDYMRIIRKRIWIAVISTMLLFVSAFYVNYYVLPSVYETDAKIYIGKEVGQEKEMDMTALLIGEQIAKDCKELLKTRDVNERAAKKLNRTDISANFIANMVQVELKQDTRILVIKVEHTQPSIARDVANVVAEVFKTEISDLMKKENVSVIDKAVLPTQPIKPTRLINVMLAAIIGLLIGAGIMFLLEYLDTSIETPNDIDKYLGLQVIGTVPNFKDDFIKRYYGYY